MKGVARNESCRGEQHYAPQSVHGPVEPAVSPVLGDAVRHREGATVDRELRSEAVHYADISPVRVSIVGRRDGRECEGDEGR